MSAETLEPVVRLQAVALHYGKTQALAGVTLDIPAGRMIGLIGPDGVGKSSLLSLVAGARAVQEGSVQALGGAMLNGDALALPLWLPRPGARWNTRIMPMEADRLCTPIGAEHHIAGKGLA